MANLLPSQNSSSHQDVKQEEHQETHQKLPELISTLPKAKGWATPHVHYYQGFWFGQPPLQGIITVQKSFEARPTDVFLMTVPKSGTTWFKALLFTIMNRNRYDFHDHPLFTANPHECVPFLELYAMDNPNQRPDVSLLSTHMPYTILPKSILASGSPIVYVYRDPKDTFVSLWHFMSKLRPKELPPLVLEDAFEQFCSGKSPYGPFWDHVLGYWKASIEWPDRVMFIKFADMKNDPIHHAKRMAEFISCPFSSEEENEGVIHKVIELCSFENLSNLEVNKNGSYKAISDSKVQGKIFFRQGKTGDWKNTLTTEMAEQIDGIIEQKLKDLV
nr:SOT2 [Ilex asprella]